MAVELKSGDSVDLQHVDANKAARIALQNDSANNGILAITGRSDAGGFTGTVLDIDPEVDNDFRLRVSMDKLDGQEPWAGTTLNSRKWSSNVTTMTTAVSGGYLRLNAAASVAANGVARVTSYQTFPIAQSFPLALDVPIQVAAASIGIANTLLELGFFIASGTAAPTDGVFLRINAAGEMRLIASYGGSETPSDAIVYAPVLVPNADAQMLLVVSSSEASLWLDDELIVSLAQPASTPTFTQSQQLPVSFRIVNSAVAPASATQLLIGPMTVSTGGMGNGQTYTDALCMAGGGGYQTQSGNATPGQTANWVNSTEPVNATPTNLVAGYTTFGGQWSIAAPAGAVTDLCLFGFQVPAAVAGAVNRNLLIRGIRITTMNLGAAVATTPTILRWAVAVGSTAVSLATVEGAATRAPARCALGMQSFPIGAAIGTPANDIGVNFVAPLVAEPGTFVQVILRVPVGTATASQVLSGSVFLDANYA